jgi:type IV pilus assembly protein PilY1
MRTRWFRSWAVASPLVAVASVAARADAQQLDLNPPRPNVLLLVDNSGSMERMIDGSLPEDNPANACDVSACNIVNGSNTTCTFASSGSPPPNRWNVLLNSLVGSPTNGFHCIAMPRSAGSTFAQEYEIGNVPPYDTGYYLPYHRAVAMDTTSPGASTLIPIPCVFAPGDLPGVTSGGVGPNGYGAGGSADSFPSNAIVTRPYGQLSIDQSAAHSLACQYGLNSDGALYAYQDILRFSLMTFDSDPDAGTGVSAASPYSVTSPPFTGMWSYFPNWGGGGAQSPATGHPAGCSSQQYDVGARNPAAPPWEGRMVPFSPWSDVMSARESQNQQIRNVLSASRPYGATPIAGMFSDAMTYLWNDPNGPGDPTNGDPYVTCGARPQYIILLTDGAPNEDLRPDCGNNDNPSAPCPYNQPWTTVSTLLAGSGTHKPVQTFVIGFAVSSGADQGGTLVHCAQLDPNGADCANPTSSLKACCELQKIAVAGQPPAKNPRAFFVDTPGDLQSALSSILATISQTTTTRTGAVFSPVTSNITYSTGNSSSAQSSFNSWFVPGVPSPTTGSLTNVGVPWTGDIQRSRYVCGATPPQQTVNASLGDDFSRDLAVAATRHFMVINPTVPSGTPNPTGTIRPYDTTNPDGLGNQSGTQYLDSATNILSVIPPSALNITQPCLYTSGLGTGTGTLTPAQCATMLLDFTFGQTFSGGPSGFPFVSRAGTAANGDSLAFGGIYHASPVVVGPPGSLLHDDSYDQFRTSAAATNQGFAPATTPAARDTMVYAATTDGLLHAFWADENSLSNNEEWAFLPPAVMPQLQAAYPGSNLFLLDGTPIVKDAVWDRQQGSTVGVASGGGAVIPWHTTLVAGFGPTQKGYYALDVTNPVYKQMSAKPNEGTSMTDPAGPAFLWQLTTVPTTNRELFGQHSTTPAITQVSINWNGALREVGVAILPGGWDQAAKTPAGTNQGCERAEHHLNLSDWGVTGGSYVPRPSVRCWGSTGNYADAVVGRSVTIVRLDTGEVIATFMRKSDAPAGDTLLAKGRIIDTPLDSPMTGTPAVFPSQVGADATKFFIGDIDGTVWRFDISNSDPKQWQGKLFYDMYNGTTDQANSGDDWNNGQPIQLPLVTSLDRQGRVVVHAASGSQDTFDLTGPNYLVSLTEAVQQTSSTTDWHAQVNWWMGSKVTGVPSSVTPLFDIGERVSGPMVVFNNTLYFTTYDANATASNVCTDGDNARLWGLDFIKPATAGHPETGGLVTGQTSPPNPYYDLVSAGLVVKGAVVPGIGVQQTTACAQVTSGADQYVPGATHATTTSYSGGSFSLVGQAGSSAGSGVTPFKISLPTPNASTLIDSWAQVTE